MNRWEVETADGKPLMLYGNSAEEIMSKYGDLVAKVVRICTYPQELFDKLTALPVRHRDSKGREYREVNLGCGYCTYRISKDKSDGRYYDLVQYRRNGGRVVESCLWSTCSASEFAELYLKPVPEKKCGWLFSVKEVKKLCGKSLFKVGAITVWRDVDGYYYIGDSREWGKRKKEEYAAMHPYAKTAVLISFTEGLYGNMRRKWFESEEDWLEYWRKITAEQPSYAATLRYEILKRGYRKLPVEDRKLICRLSYLNIERELRFEQVDTVARWWAKYNKQFLEGEDLLRKIVQKVR